MCDVYHTSRKMKSNIRKNSSLLILLILYSTLMLINCILTQSPYSAWHSGKVGSYSSSTVFSLNIAYVLLFSVSIVFLFKGIHIYKYNIGYLISAEIVFSGICNGKIFQNYNTYFFDAIMIFMISNMALRDERNADKGARNKEFTLIGKILVFSLILGLVLTLLGKGKFGYLPFDFTRSSRGEVTWWVILFLPVLFVIITVIRKMYGDRGSIYNILSVVTVVVILSTLSRTMILLFFVVFALFVFSQKLSGKKLIVCIVALFMVLTMWSKIWGFFSLGSNSIETVLNGRYGLWKLYWRAFMTNPLVGYGTNVYVDASLGASSEIGLLKDITHYGLFFGLISIPIIIKGGINSIKVIRNYIQFSKFDVLIAFINIVSIVTIIQQHARILQFSDYLCWYSIFYMNALREKIQ